MSDGRCPRYVRTYRRKGPRAFGHNSSPFRQVHCMLPQTTGGCLAHMHTDIQRSADVGTRNSLRHLVAFESRPPFTRCYSNLQTSLCEGKSAIWHSFEQYRACLHPAQILSFTPGCLSKLHPSRAHFCTPRETLSIIDNCRVCM